MGKRIKSFQEVPLNFLQGFQSGDERDGKKRPHVETKAKVVQCVLRTEVIGVIPFNKRLNKQAVQPSPSPHTGEKWLLGRHEVVLPYAVHKLT